MSKKDPTEDVLATIARIFEHADAMKAQPATEIRPAPERTPIVNPFVQEAVASPVVEPAAPPMAVVSLKPAAPEKSLSEPLESEPQLAKRAPPESTSDVAQSADGYTCVGPGPLEAIRFRWTSRADGNGGYFVDETIGPTSRAITSGPMSGDDAVAFIDLQVQEAFERFDRLKNSAAELPTHRPAKQIIEEIHAEHDSSRNQGF